MFKRAILDELLILLSEYPIVTILGPRQSGKTTLARHLVDGYQYSNLESPEERQFATQDPKAYLKQFSSKVIIDEIQRVPELLSYIQTIVDDDTQQRAGRFILTGSHQLQLREAISQSLAGRTAILNLLTLSISELSLNSIYFESFEEYCFNGSLPRIYDQSIRPSTAYSNYYQTYVERDVRQLINLKDLSLFEKLLKLLAGRVGQIVNYDSLANNIGVNTKTVKGWISILEASFVVFKLAPYFNNFGKRTIKSPKYYFTDVGLLCFILGIKKPEQVSRDPLVGNIFENLAVLECLKSRYNRGHMPDLYYYRDSNNNEVDIVFQNGRELTAIEVKSSSTYSHDQIKGLNRFKKIAGDLENTVLIYNGKTISTSDHQLLNFKDIDQVFST